MYVLGSGMIDEGEMLFTGNILTELDILFYLLSFGIILGWCKFWDSLIAFTKL